MARKGTSYYGLRGNGLGQAADVLRDIVGGVYPETVPAAPVAEPTVFGIPQQWFWLGLVAVGLWWANRR